MLTWLAHRLDGELAPDEVVDLYPAIAWRSGAYWKMRVRGCFILVGDSGQGGSRDLCSGCP